MDDAEFWCSGERERHEVVEFETDQVYKLSKFNLDQHFLKIAK